MMRRLALAAAGLATAIQSGAHAQHTAPSPAAQATVQSIGDPPPDRTVSRSITIGRNRLRYEVTAGTLPATAADGKRTGDIFYTAYRMPARAGGVRPVTFAFNGGPGAASVYLQFGLMGPKGIAFGNSGDYPSAPAPLLDNPDTWLPFTDLVFVDPIGTGFSRARVPKDAAARLFYGVDPDADYLAAFIRDWMRANARTDTPVYLVGESYGGFRVPKIASRLQTTHAIAPSGLVLLSPYLDRAYFSDVEASPLVLAKLLPSFAAARMLRDNGRIDAVELREVEDYAGSSFVADLLRGARDQAATARLVDRVSRYTGLNRDLVERLGGRIDATTFRREFRRGDGVVTSLYDAEVVGPVSSVAPGAPVRDPILDRLGARLTRPMNAYVTQDLGWQTTLQYNPLNFEVYGAWQWASGNVVGPTVETVSDLRSVTALDPNLKVLVANGYTDTVTTYFESRLAVNRIATRAGGDAIQLAVYPGGHMFYSRPESRRALLRDIRALFGWGGSQR